MAFSFFFSSLSTTLNSQHLDGFNIASDWSRYISSSFSLNFKVKCWHLLYRWTPAEFHSRPSFSLSSSSYVWRVHFQFKVSYAVNMAYMQHVLKHVPSLFSRVSTPHSNMSDSDDSNNNNNELALQGFERFRENSVNSVESSSSPTMLHSPPPSDSIAEYCAESLYSYSFTPLSRVNKAAKIKRQILNRGMDYMQRIRWRTGERDTGRRFSQPDIGVLDQTHDWVQDNEANVPPHSTTGVSARNLQLKTCPSLNDIAGSHPSGYASNPISPMTPSAPPNTVSNSPHHSNAASASASSSNLLTASGNNVPQDASATDDDGFHLGRRQTIEVFNNLPPIYEVPKPSTSMTTTSAQYTRALHAPSRFLPQNQAILTTDSDATILLFNDMASLCFGIDKSYIGKSILDALEEPFQKQVRSILKRRKSLTSIANQLPSSMRESRLEKGLVLVCGIVVPIRKMNGETSSAASLWLKEKLTEEGKSIYIWIFEEIYETSLSTKLDEKVKKKSKFLLHIFCNFCILVRVTW